MKIGERLQKLLQKKYPADAMITQSLGRQDLTFKTDESGNPVQLFIGKLSADGRIAGERFVRVLVRNPDGTIAKDHWDRKGKTL